MSWHDTYLVHIQRSRRPHDKQSAMKTCLRECLCLTPSHLAKPVSSNMLNNLFSVNSILKLKVKNNGKLDCCTIAFLYCKSTGLMMEGVIHYTIIQDRLRLRFSHVFNFILIIFQIQISYSWILVAILTWCLKRQRWVETQGSNQEQFHLLNSLLSNLMYGCKLGLCITILCNKMQKRCF